MFKYTLQKCNSTFKLFTDLFLKNNDLFSIAFFCAVYKIVFNATKFHAALEKM